MIVLEPMWICAHFLVLYACLVLVKGQDETFTATPTPKEDLTSPGYPSDYANSVTRTYLVTAEKNLVITLSIVDCEMEFETKQGVCIYDHLYIYDGANDSMPLLADFCCYRASGAWVTTWNQAYLKFTSDSSTNFRGFKLKYLSSVRPTAEEGSSNTGVIVGVVIGVIGLLIIVAFIVRYFMKKKKIFVKSPRDDRQGLWSRSHSDISREQTFFERARTFICQAPATITTFLRRRRDSVVHVKQVQGPARPPPPHVPNMPGSTRDSPRASHDSPRMSRESLRTSRDSTRGSLPGAVSQDDKHEQNLSDLERRDILLPLDGDSLRKMATPPAQEGIFDPFSGSTYEIKPETPHGGEMFEKTPVPSFSGGDHDKRPITPYNTFVGVPIKPYIGDAATKRYDIISYPYRFDSADDKPATPHRGEASTRRSTPPRGNTPGQRSVTPYHRGDSRQENPTIPHIRGDTPEDRTTTADRDDRSRERPIPPYRGEAPAKHLRDDTSYNRPLSPYSDEFYEQAPPTPYTGRTETPYQRKPKRPVPANQTEQLDKSYRDMPSDRRPMTTYIDDSLDKSSTTPNRGRAMESETPFRGRSQDQRSLTPSSDQSYDNRPLTPFIGEPFEKGIEAPFRSKTAGIRPETAESEGEFDYAFDKHSATPVSGRTTENRSVTSHKGQKLDIKVVKKLEKRPITPYGEITFLEHMTDTPFTGGTHNQRSSTPISGGRSRKRPLTPVHVTGGGLFEQAL